MVAQLSEISCVSPVKPLREVTTLKENFGAGVRQVDGGYIFYRIGVGSIPIGWDKQVYPLCSEFIDRFDKCLYRWIIYSLPGNEVKLLSFIKDRTFGFSKTEEAITKTQFFEGIEMVIQPVGLSRSSIDRGLNGLLKKGIIKVRQEYNYFHKRVVDYYSIDINGLNEFASKNDKAGLMLRKRTNKENATDLMYQNDTCAAVGVYQNDTHNTKEEIPTTNNTISSPSARVSAYSEKIKRSKIRESIEKNDQINYQINEKTNVQLCRNGGYSPLTPSPLPPGEGSINLEKQSTAARIGAQVVQDALAKQEVYKAKKAAQPQKPLGAKDIKAFWDERLAKFDTYKTGWTNKNYGQVRDFINKSELPKGKSILEFFYFAIDNWSVIIDNHLAYKNKHRLENNLQVINIPAYPDISFLMTFKKSFVAAFTRHLSNDLTDLDRLTRKLKVMGLNEASIEGVIKEEVQKSRENQSRKTEYEKKLKTLNYEKQELDREKAELIRMKHAYIAGIEDKKPENSASQAFTTNLCTVKSNVISIMPAEPKINEYERLPEELHTCAKEIYEANKYWATEEHIVNLIICNGIEMIKNEFLQKEA